MNLYLLRAHDSRGYDQHRGFVVAARSSGEARRLAGATATKSDVAHLAHFPDADHTRTRLAEELTFWLEPTASRCQHIGTYTGPETGPHVVLEDYRHG